MLCAHPSACDLYIPRGGDGKGMFRFKDYDISRQRGRGAQGDSKDERDLSPADVENASFVVASNLAATG